MNSHKKLNEIIEYFRYELEILNLDYIKSVDDRRFNFNISVLLFSAILVLVSAVISSFLSLEWIVLFPSVTTFIQVLVGVLLIFVIYAIIHHTYFDWKCYKHYFDKKIRLETILRFLVHLKVIDYGQEDLMIIIRRIRSDFTDNKYTSIIHKNKFKLFEKDRLDEYIRIIDEINCEMIKRNK